MKIKKSREKPILARARRPHEARVDTPVRRFRRAVAARWRLVVLVGGGVVVTAGLMGGYFWYRHDREVRGARAYARVTVTAGERLDEALKKAGSGGTVDEKKLKAQALEDLKNYVDRYADTGMGRAGALELAGLYYDAGKYKEARGYFERVVSRGSGLERTLAAKGVGDCERATGDYKNAIKRYEALRKSAGEAFPELPVAMALAECYQKVGRRDDAVNIYRHIGDYHAGSPYAVEAAGELAKLEALAAAD